MRSRCATESRCCLTRAVNFFFAMDVLDRRSFRTRPGTAAKPALVERLLSAPVTLSVICSMPAGRRIPALRELFHCGEYLCTAVQSAKRLTLLWATGSRSSPADTGKPQEAHPAYWAPFVVVGEGAAVRLKRRVGPED